MMQIQLSFLCSLIFLISCASGEKIKPDSRLVGAAAYRGLASDRVPASADFNDEFEDEFKDARVDVYDPFEKYNRAMTGVNDALYFWALKPIAQGYKWVFPSFFRKGIYNFFKNLFFPVRFVNNVLQLKFQFAGTEFLRFGINSTVGVLGLWDPAQVWLGLEPCAADFGQTLGYYGVGSGPHIVLPVFGPSNLRDTIGRIPDFFLNPVNYYQSPIRQLTDQEAQLGLKGFELVNETSLRIGEYESLKRDALDFYSFLRDAYEQNRTQKIRGLK